MSEPSSPVNGQNRVVEGLVTTAGAVGYRKGTNAEAVAGSSYSALDQVVTLGTTPIIGIVTETAPATDTASSGLNGRLQRIAQRLTSLIALLPAALGASGGLKTEPNGNVAHDAVDSGNPVKIGGIASPGGLGSLQAAVASGDRVQAFFDANGRQVVITGSSDGAGLGGDTEDRSIGLYETDGAAGRPLRVLNSLLGPTYSERQRNNGDATLLASAERTATTSSADQTNYNGRGVKVVFDFTVETDAGVSIVVTVEGKDALSGKYYTLLTSAALVAVGTTVLTIYPGVAAAANVSASDILPRTWRVTATPADAKRATYSVGASVIL